MLSLDRLSGPEHDQHLSHLEERTGGLRRAEEAVGISELIVLDEPAPHRLLEHKPDRRLGLCEWPAGRGRLFDRLALAEHAVDDLVRNTSVNLVDPV